MKTQRNSRCWCGSGKKYKQCHEKWDDRYNILKLEGHTMPARSLIKSPEDLRLIRKAAAINNGVLDLVAERIHAGMTTEDINTLVHNYTVEHGGIPAPLNYEGFPKSVCTSLNDEVCHGIPSKDVVLRDGDIINVDVTTIYKGHYADASRMFLIGAVSEEARRLVDVTKECLQIGIDAIKLASLNTPSSLSGSFSIIGALILGDFAIKAGWFDAEILLYMAFVALANFTQPSYEMSYAIKLFRMCMLVLIALFPRWGLLVSLVLLALVLKGQGKGYLAPLIPFRPKRLIRLLFRFSIRHSPKSGHHRNI